MKLSIIIPVYNEKNTILEVLRRVDNVVLEGVEKEVVIVDDCSTDGTKEILQSLGDKYKQSLKSLQASKEENAFSSLLSPSDYKVIFKEKNSGKGASVKLGITQATGDYITIQDADLEYDPQDLKALLKPIQNKTADVSLGSRARFSELKNIHTGWSHPHPLTYLGNKLIIASINLLYNRKGTDFFSCYKIIPRRYMVDLPVEADGFAYDVELLCKLFRKGLRVVEVPIHYNPRTFAEGKKIRYRDGLVVLWTILKWRFKSF